MVVTNNAVVCTMDAYYIRPHQCTPDNFADETLLSKISYQSAGVDTDLKRDVIHIIARAIGRNGFHLELVTKVLNRTYDKSVIF